MSDNFDLDALVSRNRVVIYKGVYYDLKELTIKEYTLLLREIEEARDTKDIEKLKTLDSKLICSMLPEFKSEMIEDLTMKQLRALSTHLLAVLTGEDEKKNAIAAEVPAQAQASTT